MLLTLSLLLTPPAHASIGAAIVLSLELPVVARDLRLGGIPPAEVRAVIVGSRERHLGGEELHAVLLRSHQAVLLNGPVVHFDELLLAQLDAGLRGPDLYVYLDDAHAKGGYKRRENSVILVPGRGLGIIVTERGHHDNGHHKGGEPGRGNGDDRGHGKDKDKEKGRGK